LLDALAPVEQYWAFPGPEAYRRARDLFASGSYDRFAGGRPGSTGFW
jgi:arginine decarboxylase